MGNRGSHGWKPKRLPEPGQELSPRTIERWLGRSRPAPPLSGDGGSALRWSGWRHFCLIARRLSSALAQWSRQRDDPTIGLAAVGVVGLGLVMLGGLLALIAPAGGMPIVVLGAFAAVVGFALIPVVAVIRLAGDRVLPPASAPHANGDKPVQFATPRIDADGDGLVVGDVLPRRIPWWQIEALVDAEDGCWLVTWSHGSFYLNPDGPWSRRVHRAITGVLAARERGCLIQGRRLDCDLPDTALSRARMPGDNDAERGISVVDEELRS